MPRAPRSCSRFARALVNRADPANPPVLQANDSLKESSSQLGFLVQFGINLK